MDAPHARPDVDSPTPDRLPPHPHFIFMRPNHNSAMTPRLCLFLGLFAASLAPAAVPPPDKLLPADTLGVFTVTDMAKARSSYGNWSASQLWRDPAMKPFKDKFMTKFNSDLVEPLEKSLGIKFSDYIGLAQGQCTLAVTQNGWEGQSDPSPGLLLLIDSREKSDLLKTNLASLKQKWVDGGKQIKTERIRDVEFTTFIFSPDDVSKAMEKVFSKPGDGDDAGDGGKGKKGAKKLECIVGQSDSLFILGTSAKDIEKVLIRQTGGTVPSLSEQPVFQSTYNSLFRDSTTYGWIHLKPLIDVANKKAAADAAEAPPPDQGFAPPRPDKIMAALGLSGLRSLAFNLQDSAEGSLGTVQLSVPESARKGLFKLIAFDAKDATPPAFIPADAVKFNRLRLDLQKAWATLESTVVEAAPPAAGVLKMLLDNAGKDKDPNFDLRKNLIENLGDDIIFYEKAPRKQTLEDLGSPPTLTLIGSAKAEQLAASLKALTAVLPQEGGKVKEREFLGRKVYALSLPRTPGRNGARPVERTLSYTASGGYVALSTDVSMLEEYLRSSGSSGKTLRDTPGLPEAAQKVGGMGTGLFGFENQSETMRATVEILKKESGTLANLFSGSPLADRLRMGDDGKKLQDWVDFSLLPSFDKIAKYFYLAVYSGNVTTEGFNFKVFSPKPPQLRK
jgi:hypothetical protein